MYICKHFKLYELIPEKLYNEYHSRAPLWGIFDDRILKAADLLREKYGKMIINDWYWDGLNQYRGYRPKDCSIGTRFSQHKFGRALDLIPQDITAEEIRKEIIRNPEQFDYLIHAVELDVSWLHIDCRNWDVKKNGVFVFRP